MFVKDHGFIRGSAFKMIFMRALKPLKYMHLFLALMSNLRYYSKVFYTLATVSASNISSLIYFKQTSCFSKSTLKTDKYRKYWQIIEIKFHYLTHAAKCSRKEVFICWKIISYCVVMFDLVRQEMLSTLFVTGHLLHLKKIIPGLIFYDIEFYSNNWNIKRFDWG